MDSLNKITAHTIADHIDYSINESGGSYVLVRRLWSHRAPTRDAQGIGIIGEQHVGEYQSVAEAQVMAERDAGARLSWPPTR